MRLSAPVRAAVALAALGEIDGPLIARLQGDEATKTLGSILSLEAGDVGRSSPLTNQSESGSDLQFALDALLRHRYTGNDLVLIPLVDQLPSLDLDPDLKHRIAVHCELRLGRMGELTALLVDDRTSPDARQQIKHMLSPAGTLNEILSSDSRDAIALTQACLGISAFGLARHAIEGCDAAPSDQLLVSARLGRHDVVSEALLGDWWSDAVAGRVASHVFAMRWVDGKHLVWSLVVARPERAITSGVVSAKPVIDALRSLAGWVPLSGPSVADESTRVRSQWSSDPTEGLRGLNRLANVVLPAGLIAALVDGEVTDLVLDLPAELDRIPLEWAVIEGGDAALSLWERTNVWRLPPTRCDAASSGGPVDLLITGGGTKAALGDLGVEAVPALQGDVLSTSSSVLVYHGHANAGGGMWSADSEFQTAGLVLDNRAVTFAEVIPDEVGGLVALCCEGSGRKLRNDLTVTGLTADAFRHGADWVFAARWQVPDAQPTMDLARWLLAELASGGSIQAARRQALAAARDSGAPPMVWLPWSVYGVPGG